MNLQLTAAQRIFHSLLYTGETMTFKDVAAMSGLEIQEVKEEITNLQKIISTCGMRLIKTESSMSLALDTDFVEFIEHEEKKSLSAELSESALQTLAVILFKNKTTKAEIDFIRGVDSSRSIKTLLLRGLIERSEEKNKKYYLPSVESLKYMNIDSLENINGRTEISEELERLIRGE